jgi:hypothetical protein
MTPRRLSKIVLAVALVATPVALLVLRYRAHETTLDDRAAQRTPSDDLATNEPPRPSPSASSTLHAHTMDKAKRDEMRERIYRAWGMTPPQGTTQPLTWGTPHVPGSGALDRDYVQQRIHDDYMPLAKDCYQQGLKKHPELAGKLVVSLRIVGTKNTGGLVDWVETASEANTLDDADVIECLKQSMYSVTFDPPPDDGYVTVTVPMNFRSDHDGGDR